MADETYTILRDYVPPSARRPGAGPDEPVPHPTSTRGAVVLEREYTQTFDDAIVYGTVQWVKGTSVTGKKWSRWVSTRKNKLITRPNKGGTIRPNLIGVTYRPRNAGGIKVSNQNFNHYRFPDSVFEQMLGRIEETTGYRSPVEPGTHRGIPLARSIYPMLDVLYPQETLNEDWDVFGRIQFAPHIHTGLGLRERTPADFVRVTFGNSRYRKDLVKAIASAPDLTIIDFAAMFRGIVPTDWLIDMMTHDGPNYGWNVMTYSRAEALKIRSLVSQMRPARQRSLLASVWDRPMLARDTMRGLNRLDQITDQERTVLLDSRTFNDMHDAIYGVERRIRAERRERAGALNPGNFLAYAPTSRVTVKIKQRDIHEKINTLPVAGFTFKCAVDADMMYGWSDYMHNCISGYLSDAAEFRGIYIGAYRQDDNSLVANIELKPGVEGLWNLKQILGKYNRELPAPERNAMIDALIDGGIIDPTTVKDAWGVPQPPQPYITIPGNYAVGNQAQMNVQQYIAPAQVLQPVIQRNWLANANPFA